MASVKVTNISSATTDAEIRDFFSFCGKISDIKVTPEGDTKNAEVTFEKPTASKTALLLNNTQLGQNHISVTSPSGADPSDPESHVTGNAERDSDDITQEEKPRARILAEYLAHGYVVGDAAIQRALELDTKHGVSSRFLSTIQQLDSKYHATDRAKAADQSYGITQRANTFMTGLNSYFEKASNHPTGKRIVKFYEDSTKQVQEVHAEARRLADLRTEEAGSAYKASGLERVFGKEKETPSSTSAATPGTAPTATAEQTMGGNAPAVANPTSAVPTDPVPGVKATDEKTG